MITTFNATITGRLGQDATTRQVNEYYAISFSLAITEKQKDKDVTSWINCTYWSKSDKIAQYLTKGKLVTAVADFFQEREHEGKKYFTFRVKDLNPFLEKTEKPATTIQQELEDT